jgi:uncharacterized phage protein gp47/JayE
MPLDKLPGELVTFQRDELVERYLRDYRIRNPGAKTQEGSQPWIDAQVMADMLAPLYANAVVIANGTSLDAMSGKRLEREAALWGIAGKLPAAGSVGFARIAASAGAWTIFAGDELRDARSGLRFRCLVTRAYSDGSHVPIGGIDVGPRTNLAAGSLLRWTSPRPGVGPTAVVVRQANGSGLSNGRLEESDGELRARIRRARARPAASGNDAEYQALIEATPDLPVQKAFTYPAILGPGSKAFVFTLRPERPGGSRIPNAAQIATALVHLVGRMPADDAIFASTLVAEPIDVALRIAWSSSAPGWTDAAPWPLFGNPTVRVAPSPPPTATTFALAFAGTTAGGAQTPPRTGATLAFFDGGELLYRRKRVRTVTVSGNVATVTCDMAHGASDPDYMPAIGQPCCPWSDSLDTLIAPVLAHFESLGPGEQIATPFDAGLRQRRSPAPSEAWPSELSMRLLSGRVDDFEDGLFSVGAVKDAAVLYPALPVAPRIGAATSLSYLLTLHQLLAFAR